MASEDENPEYLRDVRGAVADFEASLRAFVDLHKVTTTTNLGMRGILPAIVAREDADPNEIDARRSQVSQAAGRAGRATELTNVYVMVQGLGRIDPLAAWDSMTRPKPVLEPEDVFGAAAMMIGRLDAMIMKAKHSIGSANPTATEGEQPAKSITESNDIERRPRVFVGSSTEGLEVAKSLQVLLQYACEVELWSQGLFAPGPTTLESLAKTAPTFDFAVLVVSPDDTTQSRGTERNTTRDNVIFELGLFMGALGRERTFMIYNRKSPPDLPSDLAGVTPATYEPYSSGNLDAALGAAATSIERAIQQLGQRRVSPAG